MNKSPDVAEPTDTSPESARPGPVTANSRDPLDFLLTTPVVINVGLESFAEELRSQDVAVIQVDWVPPAGADPELADILSRLGG